MPVAFESFPTNRLPGPLAGAINRFLQIDQLEDLYRRTRGAGFVHGLLEELDVHVNVKPQDLARIPETGPVVAVSNHPFGILDGVMLVDLLTGIRPDVRILTNQLLGEIPELATKCIFVDTFGRTPNSRGVRQALTHLKAAGMLAIFPAGEVSHFQLKQGAIRDPEWNHTVARLIRITAAKSLPILIRGANGIPFQMLGMVHPRLRTAALPAEMLNKRGKRVEIRIGNPIDAERIAAIPDDAEAIRFLRLRTELLARREENESQPSAGLAPVAPSVSGASLSSEIAGLAPAALLEETREYAVYLAEARRIPLALQEIGRLRELTFRAAGEGTGEPTDLDRYDPHYMHLFLWNKERREIVGAYRLGDVQTILARVGRKGLYTESLFKFSTGFFPGLGPALELGRSFIRQEYQKQFAPLFLLWKGIGSYVARQPQYAILVGAVSVSNEYSFASRELIARYFEKENMAGEWSGAVRARRPLRGNLIRKWETAALCSLMPDVEDLSGPISDLEPDGKGLPVLVRQYVKLGGRLLAFSVDPNFSNALDGFVMVDLRHTNPEMLARYMGKERAQQFLNWHRTPQPRVA